MKVVKLEHQVYEIANFLSKEECDELIDLSESLGYETAKINAFGSTQIVNTHIRNNQRIIHDDRTLADQVWSKIKDHVIEYWQERKACGLNERFRFYKYAEGQEFKRHTDGKFVRNTNERSEYTLLIYLNENLTGGETEFSRIKIKPEIGKAVFFKHERRHSGNKIISGVKYVLRTDIMYRGV